MPNMPSNVVGYVILEGAPIGVQDSRVVAESGKRVIGEGCIQTAEEENRNGRCYLNPDLKREIACPRTIELLKTGNLRAENGHPMDSSIIRQQTIDPMCTVAKFLKLWMEGNDVMAQFKGCNNAAGEEFDQDLREGDLPSWSLRALGSLENVKGRNIVRDLRVITWDRVIYPSHPGAYTRRIVSESANSGYAMNESGLLIPITNEGVINYIKSESANVKSVISQIDFMYESAKLVNPSQVKLVAKTGDTFVINLEHHIANEIEAYCMQHRS